MNEAGAVAPLLIALSMPVATLTWFFEGGSMGSAAARVDSTMANVTTGPAVEGGSAELEAGAAEAGAVVEARAVVEASAVVEAGAVVGAGAVVEAGAVVVG